jgi:hypothetical protein
MFLMHDPPPPPALEPPNYYYYSALMDYVLRPVPIQNSEIMNLTDSWYESLDRGSVRHKALPTQ